MLFSGLAVALTIDAMIGYSVLYKLFRAQRSNVEILEEFLTEDQKQGRKYTKKYNDRVPKILKSNQLLQKLFTKGWKFDLFNKSGFIN